MVALLFSLSVLYLHLGFSFAMFQALRPNPQAFNN